MSTIGRFCELNQLAEERRLEFGLDFRKPEYRREVFHRFYQFHLRYKAHPGAVYYALPMMAEHMGLSDEQKYWMAFVNGNTQNPVTTALILEAFPNRASEDQIAPWFNKHYTLLDFDTDRRHHKKNFLQSVSAYNATIGTDTQEAFFNRLRGSRANMVFAALWEAVTSGYYSFGRLSTFSYLEYLSILCFPLDCPSLLLDDISGSKSHRNGLCKVLGRDDLDWHDSNPTFDGRYSELVLAWLDHEGDLLLQEARERSLGHEWYDQTNYFTLESALCTYKSWHRPNRRYPNVYNDLFHDRIRRVEERWNRDLGVWWQIRERCLPEHLRLEDNPADLGVTAKKQNHYLTTGQVIMMDQEYPEFKNAYNSSVRAKQRFSVRGAI